MTHKTIDVSEDVYKRLMELKNENESITNLILRLINEKSNSIEEFAGVFKEDSDEWEEIERVLYKERLKDKSTRNIDF